MLGVLVYLCFLRYAKSFCLYLPSFFVLLCLMVVSELRWALNTDLKIWGKMEQGNQDIIAAWWQNKKLRRPLPGLVHLCWPGDQRRLHTAASWRRSFRGGAGLCPGLHLPPPPASICLTRWVFWKYTWTEGSVDFSCVILWFIMRNIFFGFCSCSWSRRPQTLGIS